MFVYRCLFIKAHFSEKLDLDNFSEKWAFKGTNNYTL